MKQDKDNETRTKEQIKEATKSLRLDTTQPNKLETIPEESPSQPLSASNIAPEKPQSKSK